MNLPNYITLTRIASIPLLMWILSSSRFSSERGEKEILASFHSEAFPNFRLLGSRLNKHF